LLQALVVFGQPRHCLNLLDEISSQIRYVRSTAPICRVVSHVARARRAAVPGTNTRSAELYRSEYVDAVWPKAYVNEAAPVLARVANFGGQFALSGRARSRPDLLTGSDQVQFHVEVVVGNRGERQRIATIERDVELAAGDGIGLSN
jgi:hypothetical protein